MENNPDINPFNCPIPDYIRKIKNNNEYYYFKDYVDSFKNEIEFREDSKNLRKSLTELWEKELSYDFNIVGLEKMEGFSFFTDVHWVKEAIKKIFEMFKQADYRHYPNIYLDHISSFSEKPYHHIIKITQLDSYIKRLPDDPKIKNPNGDLVLIINKLINLCDYAIVSKFGDGKCYRINYLSFDNRIQIEKINCSDSINGFIHELKFYI